jgi:DivIVA domain-containing protein
MPLTPEDVVSKRFQATKFREGYDQDEVDDFLDDVVNELRRLNEENDELRQKLGVCERRVGELSRASVARESGPQDDAPKPPQPMAQPPAPVIGAPQLPVPVAAQVPEPQRPMMEAMGAGGPEAAAGMLALAQKLHDEYVRNGEQTRDRIVNEARDHAGRLVREAEDKQRQTLGSLEQERSLLERKIDELRAFEREYRSRLKSYLEGQLRDLEAKAAVVPNRGGAQQQQPQPAVAGAQGPYAGPLPSRGGYAPDQQDTTSQAYPFGGAN